MASMDKSIYAHMQGQIYLLIILKDKSENKDENKTKVEGTDTYNCFKDRRDEIQVGNSDAEKSLLLISLQITLKLKVRIITLK